MVGGCGLSIYLPPARFDIKTIILSTKKIKKMKSEIKIEGLTAIAGVPENLSANSGRLQKGDKYKIIGFYKVPDKKDKTGKVTFKSWNGVLIERLDTGAQIVAGTNTLLGQSIIFVGKDADGASAKGFKTLSIDGNCFTSPADFAHQANGDDNGTIFVVKDTKILSVNENYKPADIEIDGENKEFYIKLKDKQFYICEIVKESV